MGFRSGLVSLILFAVAMYVLFRLLSKAVDALLDRYASWYFPSWRYRINVRERESREIKEVSFRWFLERLRVERRRVRDVLPRKPAGPQTFYLQDDYRVDMVPAVTERRAVSYYRRSPQGHWRMVRFWWMVDRIASSGGDVVEDVERLHEGEIVKAGRHRFVAVETGKEHLLGWPK